jgi:hypothetical protein
MRVQARGAGARSIAEGVFMVVGDGAAWHIGANLSMS